MLPAKAVLAAGTIPETPEMPGDNSGGTMTAYVQTASGSLNLREQPGSAYRVLRTIPRGSAVTVLSYGDPWCQVTYGGTEGYVMTSFLRFDTQPTLPQEPDTDKDQGETDKPETGGSSGETSQPATPTPAPPQKQPDESTAVTAWVNTASGSLNLRYSPDSSAQIIGHHSPAGDGQAAGGGQRMELCGL